MFKLEFTLKQKVALIGTVHNLKMVHLNFNFCSFFQH